MNHIDASWIAISPLNSLAFVGGSSTVGDAGSAGGNVGIVVFFGLLAVPGGAASDAPLVYAVGDDGGNNVAPASPEDVCTTEDGDGCRVAGIAGVDGVAGIAGVAGVAGVARVAAGDAVCDVCNSFFSAGRRPTPLRNLILASCRTMSSTHPSGTMFFNVGSELSQNLNCLLSNNPLALT